MWMENNVWRFQPRQVEDGLFLFVLIKLKRIVSFQHPLLYTEPLQQPGRPSSVTFLCCRDETVQCKATWERKRCVCLRLPDHSTLLKELMVGNQARSNQTKTMEDYCLLLIPSNIKVKTMAQRIMLPTVSWVLLLQLIFMEIPRRVPAGQWDIGNSSIDTPL